MRYTAVLLMLIFVMSIAAPGIAQMYEYRDTDGSIRFTDDLGNVPEDKRENAKRIREAPYSPMPSEWQESPEGTEETPWGGNDQEETNADLVEKGEALRSEQSELQKEYESIEEERALLGDPPSEDAPLEEFEAYGDKVDELNSRILDYQERLEDHENRVEAYNARFDE